MKDKENKKKRKAVSGKNIALMLLTVFAVGGAAGGLYALVNSTKVSVCSVNDAGNSMDVVFGDYDENNYFDGTIQAGSMAEVKLNSDLTIKNVKVKKGDTVKKGDVLIEYDVHELEEAAEDARLSVKTLTNSIEMVQNEINIIERLQPSENKPQDEPEDEEEEPEEDSDSDTDSDETPDTPEMKLPTRITAETKPLSGKGTAEDPFIYYAAESGVAAKEFLVEFAASKTPSYAAFYVCDETGSPLYARVIDSSKIDKSAAADFALSDGVMISPTGEISFSGSSAEFASFVFSGITGGDTDSAEGMLGMLGASEIGGMGGLPEDFALPENFEIPEVQNAPTQPDAAAADGTDSVQSGISPNDNYVYTLKELRDMITERQEQKASLDLQKRQAELAEKNAERLSKTGGEVSPIDGEVTFAAKDKYHLSPTDAYITIANSEGFTISSHIGEYSRDKLEIGMGAVISKYPDIMGIGGTVTYIGDTPMAQNEVSLSDSFESQYEFRIVLDKEVDAASDSLFTIELKPEKEEKDSIKLPSPLVRKEAGRAYVMIADENGLLKKQYVTLGDTNMSIVEVLDGLESTDLIAFPYGKAVVGAKTKETDYNTMYYGNGLL